MLHSSNLIAMKNGLILILLILSPICTAKTYFVSSEGNDSYPGTLTQPWFTWRKAATTAVAGDTVFFRGGIYYYPTVNSMGGTMNSGTETNPICFFNYPGEEPIFDLSLAPKGSYNYFVVAQYCEWVEFDSLTVRNAVEDNLGDIITAFYVYKANNILITNCKAYNIGGQGFGIYGSNEVRVKNCDAWNLCDSLAFNPGQNGVGFQWNLNADLFPGEDMYNARVYFEGCRAWDYSDNGFAAPGHGYVDIKNCWAWNGGRLNGDGNGFKYGIGSTNNTVNPLSRLITNCIAADNGLTGFTPNNSGGNAFNGHYYNNFSYHNGYKHWLAQWSYVYGNGFMLFPFRDPSPAPNEMYSNNIAYDNEYKEMLDYEDYIHENNSWDIVGISVTDDDFISLDTAELRWPRKADGSLPDINFGKLASGSDLIDAGKNVGIAYNGTAPDLGWHESSGVTSTPIPDVPVFGSSVIQNATPSRLEMTYNLTLANIVPAASAFAVKVNNVSRSVNTVAISGTKVMLTLASPVIYGDVVTVAYTKPASNPIQTAAGGQAASITAQNVTNNVAAIIPDYVSSVIQDASPARLEMTYNLTLANIVPSSAAFTVKVNNVTRSVSAVTISGTKVLLTLVSPVIYGDAVTIAYTKPASNPIQTAAGGQAASITAQNVTNNVAAVIPAYVSSVIQNATPARLEITYNLSLASVVPAASAFAVKVNNVSRTVSSVAISGNKVLLTLASPVIYGDVVTVAYTKPASNPLQTASGGVAASISAQNVTNNVAAINNQSPVVSISSPTKSTAFIAPATITIDANASDPDGSVTKVEFYNGTSRLGEITSVPYSYTWKEVPAGTYSITAAATDNKGLKTVSTAVTVVVEKSATVVNQLPSVSIKIPNEKRPKKHDNVVIIAEANDPDGNISKVELKSGNVTIAEMTTAPYVFTLHNVDTGNYVITATATDNLGAVSISDAIELRVEDFYNPDLISLYPNPNNGFFKIDILEELPAQQCTLSIIGLTGAIVYQDIVTPGEISKDIRLPDLQAGPYVLMLTSGKIILTTKKFIKQ